MNHPSTTRPIISIITVCRNAGATIAQTIGSVELQELKSIEYIIIDGVSTDETLKKIEGSNISPHVISEPDNGIYDAMNKGLEVAKGDFVFFLNADDRFCDAHVIRDVIKHLQTSPDVDLLIGNVIYVYPTQTIRKKFGWITPNRLLFGDLNHQCVFARRTLFQKFGKFDLRYRIAADFDWLLRTFNGGIRYEHIDRDICYFKADGAHSKHSEALKLERHRIQHSARNPIYLFVGRLLFRAARKLRFLSGYRGERC